MKIVATKKGIIVQGLDIIIFAGIAVFFILKMMGVLGQRSENEEPNDNADKADRNLINLHQKYQQAKKRARDAKANGETEPSDDEGVVIQLSQSAISKNQASDIGQSLKELDIKPNSKIGKGLKKIDSAMKSFDPNDFITGAEAAFEMILEAYAQGDLQNLKLLLTKNMYKIFSDAIKQREKDGHRLELTVLAINDISFISADIVNNQANLTVKIVSEQNSVLYNTDDKVIEGDKKANEVIEDLWTFSKSTNSSGPNWHLAATGSAE
ncbi:MAG: Tim44/TimA family putative adaptor protein [Alphaproteobacteria bacterium]|nr:Tim44/TimA family putative adaptor protein [Alphaproteobacteria bacterium]